MAALPFSKEQWLGVWEDLGLGVAAAVTIGVQLTPRTARAAREPGWQAGVTGDRHAYR